MISKCFQTEEGRKAAEKILATFEKTGNKEVNVDNFISLDYTYCRYTLEGKEYNGYFTSEQARDIQKVLDYYEGEILVMNG